MKVILQKDVPRIGRKYDVKDVPDGHALNFLLPRKLAERATPEALKRLETKKSQHSLEIAESDKTFADALKKAADAEVMIAVEASDEGGLYRAVRIEEIASAFSEKGILFEERSIQIDTPIKHTGTHTIRLASGGREGECVITVVKA